MNNSLFMGNVEYQVHKDWERRFNKRVARRTTTLDTGRFDTVRSLVDKLRAAF